MQEETQRKTLTHWKEGIQKILEERGIEWKGLGAIARDYESGTLFVNPLHLTV